MATPSVFTRIIQGEIPCHKLYEDARTIVFLDIHPSQPGHALVVPKAQVNRLEDLQDDDYMALMNTLQAAMRRVITVFGGEYRACVKVEGFDVPHAHIHVIPCRSAADFAAIGNPHAEPDHAALADMAKKMAW